MTVSGVGNTTVNRRRVFGSNSVSGAFAMRADLMFGDSVSQTFRVVQCRIAVCDREFCLCSAVSAPGQLGALLPFACRRCLSGERNDNINVSS